MRLSPLRTLSCAAATALALTLAVPASAAESQGSLEPAPQADASKSAADQAAPAPKGAAGSQAVTYQGAVFPLGDTDRYNVLLVGGGGTIFTFGLYNFTPGFNPAMVIRGAGRSFFVNRSGPNGSEFYRLLVRGTVRARVTVGAFRGGTVGDYVLKVTP